MVSFLNDLLLSILYCLELGDDVPCILIHVCQFQVQARCWRVRSHWHGPIDVCLILSVLIVSTV